MGRKLGRKKLVFKVVYKIKFVVLVVKGVLKCDECSKEYVLKRVLNRYIRIVYDVKKY